MNKVEFKEFTIEELVRLYEHSNKIISDITLQRDIVYNAEKQAKVIDTVYKDLVLPTLIFWKRDDDVYEVIDGKQRLHSITEYVQGRLTYENKTIKELSLVPGGQEKVNEFLKKKIYAQIHSGSDEERRESFYRINTSGVPLNNYEIINGLIDGRFIKELDLYVQNNKELKQVLGEVNNRGNYQYEIFKRITKKSNPIDIVKLIDKDSSFSKLYKSKFNEELRFITKIFLKIGSKYPSLETIWNLAEEHSKEIHLFEQRKEYIHRQLKTFYADKDLQRMLTSKEKDNYLKEVIEREDIEKLDERRFFNMFEKEALFKDKKYTVDNIERVKCAKCNLGFEKADLAVDHIVPWSKGGRTELSNAQLLCKSCNSTKGNK